MATLRRYDNVTENIDVIVKLIDDYSSKLRSYIDKFDSTRRRLFITLYLATALLISLTLMVIFLIRTQFFDSFDLPFVLLATFALIFPVYYYTIIIMRKIRLIKEDIKVISEKIEYVMRLAVQFEEHGERDLGKRLEIDFRLVEARSVLRSAELVDKTIMSGL